MTHDQMANADFRVKKQLRNPVKDYRKHYSLHMDQLVLLEQWRSY